MNVVRNGVFRGTRLFQKTGSIGGGKGVFVHRGGSKDDLVTFPIGGRIMNGFKGDAKMFAGDLCEYRTDANGVNPKIYLLKTYLVESVSGTTLNIVRDGFKHIPFVGDKLGVAPEKIGGEMTSATIVAVSKGKVGSQDVWVCTTSDALTAKKGDVLVDADTDGTMAVKAINGVVDCDIEMFGVSATEEVDFDAVHNLYTPMRRGEMYISKMSPIPACVLEENTSKVNGWFRVDY
jgi:hypothetical protein